jgi:uncharacterized RDD family membrane protein YckC
VTISESKTRKLAVTQQGHYAGAVTRFAAFVVDSTVMAAVFSATVAIVIFAVSLVTRNQVNVKIPTWLLVSSFAIWWMVYFAYPWAVSGRTPGMSLLGIRVVQRDGSRLRARQAFIRALTLPISFLILGLGFVGIVVGRERRALHDHFAHSAVVYSWDARAAQLRFLANDRKATATAD